MPRKAVKNSQPEVPEDNGQKASAIEEADLNKSEAEKAELNGSEKSDRQPVDYKLENTVTINGIDREIKETRFEYYRIGWTSARGLLENVPIDTLFVIQQGVYDPKRDGLQIIFDFLVAVFDDEQFVRDNFDYMTAADIEKILEIYRRINKIEEKEEAAKNREAKRTNQ